jgi:hypothetical protein
MCVVAVEIIFGYITGKVTNNRVIGLGAEQLQGVLPLLSAHELRVGDDFDS